MSFRGHLWTVAPLALHRLRGPRFLAARPWETALEDPRVGTVRLSGWLREVPGSGEILVLVHGLGGGTESHYLGDGLAAAEAAGISSLRVNLRGSDCRGEDFYHAGLTADLHAALASAELRRYERIYVLGYSLGGHLTLRLGTEAGDPRLAAVAAICAPLDLAVSQREIDSPWRWPYRLYLVKGLFDIYAAVAARHPVPLPVEEARRIRTIREWDDRIVAPRHGFAGAADYYARESVAPRLPDLRVPALLLASEWDPMVPAHTIRAALTRPAPRLQVRWIAAGGHNSFPRALAVDRRAVEWLRNAGVRVEAPPAARPAG
ncbi:MAG TPA: alpha/beta fold hydrolase [Thermoanaerobaculia bacterium]